jgi:DegV family protein with EDD domain
VEFVVITGMSGAGKTQTVKFMEDMGYFCVDNLPTFLLPKFAELCGGSELGHGQYALVLDVRGGDFVQELLDFFRSFTDKGYEVVHLDISAELSNTFNAARLAAAELEGVYPVDSRMLSTGVGLLCIEGAECRDRGMGAAEIAEHLRALTDKVDTSFVLDTLEFMWKGGRCSGVTALGANLLHLKPALEMKDGKLDVYKKYRGNIKSVYRQYARERLAGKDIRPNHIFVTDSGEVPEETVTELMDLVRQTVPGAEVHSTKAGCTVTSHCGPKTLGVLFIRE